ncbi:MAG TPA: polymer-forming cytoskeletal protein [Solirubrobacterales bacterium]|nr:polymer-forming cytoskeletal protein [Solirubrobacterales bacterium]
MIRRVSSLAVLVFLCALALPAAAPAAPSSEPLVVIAGDVHIEEGEAVDEIIIASGDLRLDGGADGDVVVFSGDATIGGRINGDLVVFDGQANLLPSAHIEGDVRYGDERPLVAGEAIVLGDVKKEDWPDSWDFVPFVGAFVFWLAISISLAILGVLLLLIAPRAAAALEARSRERVGPLIAIGFAVAIALPLAGGIAAVTLVGLPLAFLILLALLPLAALAYVASAYVLGRRIVKEPKGRIWAFLAGLAILRLLALVPLLGFLVGLAAAIFGLGLIGAAIGAARDRDRPQPAPSPDS